MNDEELKVLLRSDLTLFIERVFMHLFPETPYKPNWHIELIASKLEAVFEGRIRRLIINVPPRSLKSVMASVSFVAWALGHKPSMQFICASYGQDLADKLAQDCRSVMLSEWYRQLFSTRLDKPRPPVSDFHTQAGGGRFATSVGGVLTGRGGDVIIIDDPVKPDEAMSDTARRSANEWFDHTVSSRLNDKCTGAIVIIMQRLHEDDLVGHVLEQNDWEVLALPAIAEEEQCFSFPTLDGERKVIRRIGDVLHPDREPPEVLMTLRATLGDYHFAGQYQQVPVPLGGGMFKLEWLRYYEPYEKPEEFDLILQSWDTSNKESELNNFSVCTTWGIKNGDKYLLDVRRERMDYPTLKRAVLEQIRRFNPQVVLIEDKASGIQLIQELRSMDISIIQGFKPEGDKVMRAHAQTGAFEGGFVRLPRQAPWLDAYVQELTTFPRGKFNDQVDSTVQALAWSALNGVEPAITRALRQQYEELYGKKSWGNP